MKHDEIYERLDKLDNKVDIIIDKLNIKDQRLTKIETRQNGMISILAIIFTAVTGYLINLIGAKL